MAKKTRIIRHDVDLHPAVLAWIQLHPGNRLPTGIEIIKESRIDKTAIFRLIEAGIGGSSIIVKRCPKEAAALDRTFYEHVLPHIPVSSAEYFGHLDNEEDISWLFLEDVGDVQYSHDMEEHRVLATRWMATFHTSTDLVPPTIRLPSRGLDYYFGHLKQARETIGNNLNNEALSSDDRSLLNSIIIQCNLLESKWDGVRANCGVLPKVLTHGDFKKKNIRIRSRNEVTDLIALDWETSGLGIPTVDIAESKIDVKEYWLLVQNSWPQLDLSDLQMLTEIGKILRYLAATHWEAEHLTYEWIRRSMMHMEIYHGIISEALNTLNLAD